MSLANNQMGYIQYYFHTESLVTGWFESTLANVFDAKESTSSHSLISTGVFVRCVGTYEYESRGGVR